MRDPAIVTGCHTIQLDERFWGGSFNYLIDSRDPGGFFWPACLMKNPHFVDVSSVLEKVHFLESTLR